MLILKLNLPEAKVNYNYLGACTSALVPYTPDKIKGIQMDVEITGYLADDSFFAFRLTSPDRALSMSEQFTLLSKMGFKTIPVERYPTVDGAVNNLIHAKARFAKYGAYWWDQDSNSEYRVPELVTINDVYFTLDAHRRLVRILKTDMGEFTVIDHRIPEYYQVGSTIKVMDGVVTPFQSSQITTDIPYECPICNNPLKKYQVANDLPLIYKCVSPFCYRLGVTSDPIPEPVVEDTEDTSFRQQTTDVSSELSSDEDNVEKLDDVVTAEVSDEPEVENKVLRVINLEVDVDSEEFKTKVLFLADGPADYVLKNSPRSATRASRKIAQQYSIPLITLEELRKIID